MSEEKAKYNGVPDDQHPDLKATMKLLIERYNEDEPTWAARPRDWVDYANGRILDGMLQALESLTEEQEDEYDAAVWVDPITAATEVGQ